MKKNSICNLKNKIKGFTLVELLVVISIIAMLLAILLPSLNKAREIAKNTVCKSNLKQISMGISLYANDNDEYLPLHCAKGKWWVAPPTGYTIMWFDLLAKYDVSAASGVLQCPSDRYPITPKEAFPYPQGNFRENYNEGYISYRYNVHYNRSELFNDKNYYPQKITDLKYPSKNLIIADGVSVKGGQALGLSLAYDFALDGSPSFIGNRHNRGNSYFFNGLLGDMSINTWQLKPEVLRSFRWEYPH